MGRLGRIAQAFALGMVLASGLGGATAQDNGSSDERGFLDGLEYRNIGPWRGGRATAAAGSAAQPFTFYIGTTGGVWKTTNAGASWNPVSDDDFKTAAVGALDVAPSNANIVVAGMGESPYRGVASSQGDGVYKSVNGGDSWTHLGLEGTRQISSIRIHPTNPDVIWVAAQGDSWGPSSERGVYKTTDGGETWVKTLAGANGTTGAIDLKYDLNNPLIVYASMWDHQRKPWQVRSGGEGSGLYKSEDGGDTWTRLENGLPETMGKMGIAPSPAKSGRVWAVIEAPEGKGGVYRSDDAGESWKQVNKGRRVQARSWYYMHIFADTTDPDTVYVLNAPFLKSIDGGKSFTQVFGSHGDHHDLWVNPQNSNFMVNANDGGGTVSIDGGASWTGQHNQPTAQFYRVITDNQTPYRLYAGQQDNSTVSIPSRAPDGRIGRDDYHSIGGGESAHVAFDPDNPRYIYAGSYLGFLSEYDSETKTTRYVTAYPELRFGVSPSERKYRWNWNAPVHVSHHDSNVIFHAGNHVFVSRDRGTSWEEYSPDLTRDEEATQGPGGTPITNEVSENYNTILYLTESEVERGVMYVGTDDGRLQITRDDGASWQDITPRRISDGMFNAIEISPHDPATAYVAYTRYKYSDLAPYIYKTTNYGRSWTRIDTGLPEEAFVRVIREDPEREGLLYAGTERGLFYSLTGGQQWQPLQLNLPVVPVTDLRVQDRDLVVATQGRSFWILDDVSPLRQFEAGMANQAAHLFAPETGYLWERGGGNGGQSANPPSGAVIYYSLSEELDLKETELKLEILSADGTLLRTLKTDAKAGVKGGRGKLAAETGINRVSWDMRREAITDIPGVWTTGGGDGEIDGYLMGPGTYTLKLSLGDEVVGEAPLQIEWDPRLSFDASATSDQQAMVASLHAMVDELHGSINALRAVKAQAETRKGLIEKQGGSEALMEAADAVIEAVDEWEASVISTEREFFQDVLNWPDRLASDLQVLYGAVDGARHGLTKGMRDRFADLEPEYTDAVARRDAVISGQVAAFNTLFAEEAEPGLALPPFVEE